jgi:hypothetical protein
MHFENWRIDSWPDVDHLAGYSNAINLRAVDIIKKITDDYIPPIVIVSLNGLHR